MNLFISYSRDDEIWVKELWHKLRAYHDAWIDRQLVPGQDWWDTILQRIEDCECCVYIMTPASVGSIYCRAEMDYALALNKPIVPLMLKPCDYPSPLKDRRIQYENVQDLTIEGHVLLFIERALGEIRVSKAQGKYQAPHPLPSRPEEPKPEKKPEQVSEVFRLAEAAENANNPSLAEKLFQQVIDADPEGYGLAAAERLTSARIKLASEQERKLEAAMPACTQLGTESKLKVKISLPGSEGLRAQLPELILSGAIIQKHDVRSIRIPLWFLRDKRSGQLLPGIVYLRIEADHFTVRSAAENQKARPRRQFELEVPTHTDSRTLNFILSPKPDQQKIGLSTVYIRLYQEGKFVADTYVETHIVQSMSDQPSCGKWQLMVRLLTRMPLPARARSSVWLRLVTGAASVLTILLAFLALYPQENLNEWLLSLGLLPTQTHTSTYAPTPTYTPTPTPTLTLTATATAKATSTPTDLAATASQTPGVPPISIIRQFSAPGMYTNGITWDGSYLWITDNNSTSIFKVETDGNVLGGVPIPMGTPEGLTWDGSSFWLFTTNRSEIYQFEVDGWVRTIIGSFVSPNQSIGGGLNDDLAWDGTNLYYSDQLLLYQLDTSGNVLNTLGFGWNIKGVDWDGDYLWICFEERSGTTLNMVDTSGNVLYSEPIEIDVQGLTWDGQSLWAADSSTIYQLDVSQVRQAVITQLRP